MFNKNTLKGIVLGILIGGVAPVYGWMMDDDVCELKAGDLSHVVKDAISNCEIINQSIKCY